MMKHLLLAALLIQGLISLASASLKITFSGADSYIVNINGSKHYVDNQYLQLDNMMEGNYNLKFSVRHGMTNIHVHSTSVYLQRNTETIAIFENDVLQIKAVNQLNNGIGGGNQGWSGDSYFSDNDFQAILEEVEKESFDSKKREKIIALIKNGKISSAQGKLLLETFSFDNERYDAAVEMVPYIYDKQNLWQIGETFTFKTNKDDFLEYIDSSGSGSNSNNNWNGGSWGPQAMDGGSFNSLLEAVEDESFDSKKTELILNSIKHSKITTQQAIQLLEAFSFDSDRLDAAKQMVPYIFDRQNYWKAGEVFEFNSNKDEFLQYIQ